jgi:O-antigen ligase
LYFTDILIFFLLLLEIQDAKCVASDRFLREAHKFKMQKYGSKVKILLGYCFKPRSLWRGAQALLIGLLILLNVYYSLSPFVSLYKWLKVLEFGFLIYWVVHFKFQISNFKLLLIPIFYTSVLAFWQFINQGSIGGLWWWLGERTFNGGTPGIANAAIAGQLVLRPYATFPHPNVLGGWLAAVLVILIGVFPQISRKLTARAGIACRVGLALGAAALLLSLSRVAILAGLLGAGMIFRRQKGFPWKKTALVSLVLPVLFVAVLSSGPHFLESESWQARWQLSKAASEQFTRSPLWGTGLGTAPLYHVFGIKYYGVGNYALAFQPPHNIYLLLLSETGIVGVLVFGYLIWRALRRPLPIIHNTLYIILILGLFDHYFLTLQQGQLLLALVLGLAFAGRRESS